MQLPKSPEKCRLFSPLECLKSKQSQCRHCKHDLAKIDVIARHVIMKTNLKILPNKFLPITESAVAFSGTMVKYDNPKNHAHMKPFILPKVFTAYVNSPPATGYLLII